MSYSIRCVTTANGVVNLVFIEDSMNKIMYLIIQKNFTRNNHKIKDKFTLLFDP